MDNTFKNGCPGRGLCAKGCAQSDKPLTVYDYLADLPFDEVANDLVEVQFKNTRKGYYHNSNHLPLEKGDIVAVEASPGHDIGVVTLTGRLVELQVKKAGLKSDEDIKRIYRKARPTDMEKYEEARSKEHDTMIRSRQIAQELGLEMKIGDVEYQGDGGKAIFYYIADGRVDFRQLIKILAETFRVRIEMKQIGARQEAGRIGGIGPCGRILCCAAWMKNFVSVSTGSARLQDLSPNPQKLAGQCAKLKCCLNFEADSYIEATKKLPSKEISLHTQDAEYFYFKADILKGEVTYSTDKHIASNLITLPASQVFEIIAMNRRGEKPAQLTQSGNTSKQVDLAQQESLTRFDKKKKSKKKNNNNKSAQQSADSTEHTQETSKADKNETANNTNKQVAKEKGKRENAKKPQKTEEQISTQENTNRQRKDRKNNAKPNRQRPDKNKTVSENGGKGNERKNTVNNNNAQEL